MILMVTRYRRIVVGLAGIAEQEALNGALLYFKPFYSFCTPIIILTVNNILNYGIDVY